ncbi:type VI secretion system accessory protein TagJ [Roseobacter sp.]|uniref:type VI secretion system accessory protein TagJ n=1 Tax=Roseobacter sp. TaxID=1907202 RepID=UPI003299EEE2
MLSETLLKTGDVPAAYDALKSQVRAAPDDARLRIFLFQILCVLGDWPRAAQQLKTCVALDPAAAPMAALYGPAIAAEQTRARVLRGETPPPFDAEGPSWLPVLWDALKKQAAGDQQDAETLRAMALRAAPATAGQVDGQNFEWIADADARFGPVLEIILEGEYRWLPFAALRRMTVQPPQDLRDLVWAPVTLTLVCGRETGGLLPVRYPATTSHGTSAHMLARGTDWNAAGEGTGQRMFCTPEADVPLLALREVTIGSVASPKAVHHG